MQDTRKLQVKILYDSLGYCTDNNLLLAHSLKEMGVSLQHVLPYINNYKYNTCTANLDRYGYLLTPTTDPLGLVKDSTPTPSLSVTSVLDPVPILDASVITDPFALVTDSLMSLSPTEVPLLETPLTAFVETYSGCTRRFRRSFSDWPLGQPMVSLICG